MEKHAQLGRSMIEMLGVLAVVGVLSIAAVFGYSYAVTKYKANTTIKDLELRAITLSSSLEKTPRPLIPGQILIQEFGDKTTLGYQTESFVSPNNTDYFEIELANVPTKICRQILKDYTVPTLMFANEKAYKGDTSVCGTAKTVPTMNFVYPVNLSAKSPCSDKGFFDENALACKCSGNTYFNPFTQDCACPAGFVWSELERTCIESICKEGEFKSADNVCIPCEDPGTYIVNTVDGKRLCNACPNRTIYQGQYCSIKCIPGDTFSPSNGICLSCNTFNNAAWLANVQTFPEQVSLCNACPNRYTSYGLDSIYGHCLIKTYCQLGKTFSSAWLDGSRTCRPCDTSDNLWIGGAAEDRAFCEACTNTAGVKNRQVTGNYCSKVICDANEFKGSDGVCYSCTEPKKIAVDVDFECEAPACGRTVVNGLCQIKNCTEGEFITIANGSCYACDTTEIFKSTQAECEGHCTKVERRWVNGLCKLNICKKGINYPYEGTNNTCYACSVGVATTGTSEWSREYCEACGNYLVTRRCINPNACKKGSEFRRAESIQGSLCASCDIAIDMNIGDHIEQKKMCNACTTTKRFGTTNNCFRCDTSLSPAVTTQDEKEACLACGVREVKNGKCLLKQ